MLAAMAKAQASKPREATAATGGRIVSLTDGREYVVSGNSMVFGRDAGCDVVITDKNVSRRHAEIMATPKGYVLIDSSTNGTFINGARVDGQRVLARADVIRIGNDEFRFYADRAPAPAAPPPGAPPGAAARPAAPAPAAPAPAAPPSPPPPAPSAAKASLGTAAGAGSKPAAAPGAPQRLAHTVSGIPVAPPQRPSGAPAAPAAPAPPRATPPAPPAQAAPPAPPAPPAQAPKAPVPPRAPAGPPVVLANLVVRTGSLKGQRLPIRVPIVNVGRAEYNDVVLPDDSVSTTHAKLQRREGVWVLVDLDSTNGCFVDAERVQGETPLAPGALIRFGEVQVLFEPTDDTVDAAKGSSTKMMSAIRLPPSFPA
jgi:pSer/pThr/pTyr-binding forkhead associated (FHA) protein